MATSELIERLAAHEHEQWAHWTRYMLDNLTEENIARWRQQIDMDYHELSEHEKRKRQRVGPKSNQSDWHFIGTDSIEECATGRCVEKQRTTGSSAQSLLSSCIFLDSCPHRAPSIRRHTARMATSAPLG